MKVSVIIPHVPGTRGAMLKRAILSVHEQAYKDWELVLSQDGNGIVENINNGLNQSKGELVHILHDDDWLNPNSMEWAVKGIIGNDWIHGDMIKHFDKTGREVTSKPSYTNITFQSLLEKNPIRVASVYYRKSALMDIGGWYPYGNELATHLELLYNHKKLGYVPRVLSYYRIHEGQSGNGEWYKQNGQKVRKQMIQSFYDRIK